MKSFKLFALITIVFLASCNKDSLSGSERETDPVTYEFMSPNHFYGTAFSELTKGTAQMNNLWYVGTVIKVRLLHDPYRMADKIEAWAKEWEEYANVTFEFVDEGYAHVRIGFDWNENRWITWSYIGTDCKMVSNQNDATMSFAFWQYAESDEELRADVLRAFGQVLGLDLEHRHLGFDAGWVSEAQIAKIWTADFEDIPWEQLRKYVFTPLNKKNAIQSQEYDPESIMIWPFARQYAVNTQREFNYELSETDKEFVTAVYPFDDDGDGDGGDDGDGDGDDDDEDDGISDEGVLVKMRTSASYIALTMEGNATRDVQIRINWGDGSEEETKTFYAGMSDAFQHSYEKEASFNVRIYGDRGTLQMLHARGQGLKKLQISNSDIEILTCNSNEMTELDISGCSRLWHLNCASNQLTDLDVSQNLLLEYLDANDNEITSIDLSANTLLSELNVSSTGLEQLELSANTSLIRLHISGTPLSESQPALLQMAESLAPVTKASAGIIYLYDETAASWIETICSPKKWNIY